MPDRLFRDCIDINTHKMNPMVMNGLAVEHFKGLEKHMDSVFRSANKGFPDGLEYVGCQRTNPFEEYLELTKERNGKRYVNMARSDVYLMKYFFRYKGIDLPPRYIYLPFVGEAGTMFLGGSRYLVTPILTDKVISPTKDSVFVRLLRDKVTFYRTPHTVVIDGVRETVSITHSEIYRTTASAKRNERTTKAVTTLIHYLFAKYGFFETFEKYLGFKPILGTSEINEKNYPRDEYVIVESSGVKPRSFIGKFYEPTHLRMAIPKDYWNNDTRHFVSGAFYVIDHFPSRLNVTTIEHSRTFVILLGHIIFSGVYAENELHKRIEEHYVSLDEYMDESVKQQLEEIGYHAENFFDLLAIAIKMFNKWIIEGNENITSLYDKELSILYHILFSITSGLFNFSFKLTKAGTRKDLEVKDVMDVLNKYLKTGLIYSITKSHVNMMSLAYSGDNKYFKMTSIMTPQAASNRTTRKKKSKNSTSDRSKKLHVSLASVGSYINLPKSSPRGDSRINPYLVIGNDRMTTKEPEVLAALLQQTQYRIDNKDV